MPELPEVETICRLLENGTDEYPGILDNIICKANVLWDKSIEEPSVINFTRWIENQIITQIFRRGKFIVIQLSEYYLLIHLRMSGDIRIVPSSKEISKHDRVILELDSDWCIIFNDTRKFGRVWLVREPAEILNKLGAEPLGDEFTWEAFHRALQNYRRQIKPLLMDQKFIAGLGNIYTDEALYLAKLHPLTRSDTINSEQSRKLLRSIRVVLENGIQKNGASIDWVYRGGDFQNYFNVYGKAGHPCQTCGVEIERIVVGQRGTHICPSCQQFPTTR